MVPGGHLVDAKSQRVVEHQKKLEDAYWEKIRQRDLRNSKIPFHIDPVKLMDTTMPKFLAPYTPVHYQSYNPPEESESFGRKLWNVATNQALKRAAKGFGDYITDGAITRTQNAVMDEVGLTVRESAMEFLEGFAERVALFA